jgi:Ca2+-binding EF-hand superfamily protein
MLINAFSYLDTNGDGLISLDDLKSYFQKRGYKFSNTEVEDLIWLIDDSR